MHRQPWTRLLAAPSGAAALVLAAFAAGSAFAQEPATVIRGATVFTGDEVLETATVTIRGRTIEAVTAGDGLPPVARDHATVVDGRGMTLLPGLIDAHTHSFGPALEEALNFGVTTVLDMFTEPNQAAAWRREQAAGPVTDRADLFSAGVAVTVENGHGTQFGVPIPTLDDPEQTEAFIAARVGEGSDWIKVVYEHGETSGWPVPTLDESTLPRIVAAARAHDKLAVFHVSTAREAIEAIVAEADGLVHVWHDRADAGEAVAAAVRAGIFVIPTLTVTESLLDMGGGAELAADPRIAPFLTPAQAGGLRSGFGGSPSPDAMRSVLDRVGALHAAGVPLLAGSDAPNPGTAHGASVYRELELLVRAGLSPFEALRAATAVPADAFGLDDRGRIVPGMKADLVLVRGDATRDVAATRDLAGIWKDGVRVERVRPEAVLPGRPRIAPRVLTDFEDLTSDDLAASGWIPSTDAMFGGGSTVDLRVTAAGGDGAGGALVISGEIAAGFPAPWAGVMIGLAPGMMQPVDASDITALVFDARGEGATYRVLAFAESLGPMPATIEFTSDAGWRRIVVPLGGIDGLDPTGAMGFLISGPGTLGPFRLEVDNVELR